MLQPPRVKTKELNTEQAMLMQEWLRKSNSKKQLMHYMIQPWTTSGPYWYVSKKTSFGSSTNAIYDSDGQCLCFWVAHIGNFMTLCHLGAIRLERQAIERCTRKPTAPNKKRARL